MGSQSAAGNEICSQRGPGGGWAEGEYEHRDQEPHAWPCEAIRFGYW